MTVPSSAFIGASRLLTIVCFVVLFSDTAYAHTGAGISPQSWFSAWGTEPYVVAPLVAWAWLYAVGWVRLRSLSPQNNTLTRAALLFLGGWLFMLVALVSPVHPLGQVLFSAHMSQHELLMVAAAPLLVLARPAVIGGAALPRPWRTRVAGSFARCARSSWGCYVTDPLTAWLVHGLVLWLWHAPYLFQATLYMEWVHALQHISFFGTAYWFWHTLLRGRARRRGYGLGVLYLFTTALHTGALGALLTFANSVWYPAYAATAPVWGLSPIEDQQLGGLIMWIPGGMAYVVAGLILFAGWLQDPMKEASRP